MQYFSFFCFIILGADCQLYAKIIIVVYIQQVITYKYLITGPHNSKFNSKSFYCLFYNAFMYSVHVIQARHFYNSN